jgi:tRNA threonylcarbamoyladenosine biosynthesis protein TsaE
MREVARATRGHRRRTPDPLPILETRTLLWPGEAACAASAQSLAAHPEIFEAGIELQGQLAAGKTTFARHLLRALGVEGRIKSPSYAVVEPYELPHGTHAWHFDFYRFDDAREWDDAGLRELFAERGLKLVEWPERAAGRLPEPDLHIALEVLDGDRRRAVFSARSAIGRALLPW